MRWVYASEVRLEWDVVADARVDVYELHYGTQSGSYASQVDTASMPATVTGLKASQTYFFAVRACDRDAAYCSAFSNEVSVTIPESAPQAGYSADVVSGQAPLRVQFSDGSTGEIEAWAWDFGDGSQSTAQSPQHTYVAAGTYAVTLTVTGPGGESTETKHTYIQVTPPAPVAAFTAGNRSGYAPLTVVFGDTSQGTITRRTWDLGDGSTSPATDVVHTYTGAGAYTVKLVVGGPAGVDEEVKADYINVLDPAPVADFAADLRSGSAPLAVQFSDLSQGAVDSWQWDFGDGTASGQRQPVHTYTAPGLYAVTLSASGPAGADTLTRAGYIEVTGPDTRIEVGELSVDDRWQRVDFRRSFAEPIVIATPLSFNNSEPALVRVEGIDRTGFSIRVQEWDHLDGWHAPETVSYIVMERGQHRLPDGTWVEAGSLETTATGGFVRVAFGAAFATAPVVLAAVNSSNETDAVTARLRRITATGFQIGMREQESNVQRHAQERIDFIAWEPSAGVLDGVRYLVGPPSVPVTHAVHTLVYPTAFTRPPMFLAKMQTTNAGDTAELRWRDRNEASVDLWVSEERSRDAEVAHKMELVGYVLLDVED